MFFELPDGSFLNLAHVRRIVFNAARNRTEIFFSDAQHDSVRLDGDRRSDIISATTKTRR